MTNYDILSCVETLRIANFRGVFCRDTLPGKPECRECGIFNLNLSSQEGSHWVCWFKNGEERCYFDSFGIITPLELQRYLKTPFEFENNKKVIFRNTERVQEFGTTICGELCLFMLSYLSSSPEFSFQSAINSIKNGHFNQFYTDIRRKKK